MSDLTTLSMDRDTLDLGDGRTLRLRIEPDQDYNPFEEVDCYGSVAPLERWERQRPDGFNGNAEKLTILNDVIWWQPPKEGPKRGTPEFVKFRSLVSDLASWGAHIVTLEVLQGVDAYRRPIVVNVASLGGIDSLDDGYLDHVIGELARELDLD